MPIHGNIKDVRLFGIGIGAIVGIFSAIIGIALFIGGLVWFVYTDQKMLKEANEKYRQYCESHSVVVHFKNGTEKRFDKNGRVDVDSTGAFGTGMLYYIIQPSGAKVPCDGVSYTEIVEMN